LRLLGAYENSSLVLGIGKGKPVRDSDTIIAIRNLRFRFFLVHQQGFDKEVFSSDVVVDH